MTETGFSEAFPDLWRRATSAAASVLGRAAADTEDVAAETLRRAFVRWDQIEPRGRAPVGAR